MSAVRSYLETSKGHPRGPPDHDNIHHGRFIEGRMRRTPSLLADGFSRSASTLKGISPVPALHLACIKLACTRLDAIPTKTGVGVQNLIIALFVLICRISDRPRRHHRPPPPLLRISVIIELLCCHSFENKQEAVLKQQAFPSYRNNLSPSNKHMWSAHSIFCDKW